MEFVLSQPWQPPTEPIRHQQWAPPAPPPVVPAQWGPQPRQWPVPPHPVKPVAQNGATSVILGGVSLGASLLGLLVLPILLGPVGALCGFIAAVLPGSDSRGRGMGGVGLLLGIVVTVLITRKLGLVI